MKKLVAGIVTAAIVLSIGLVNVMAATSTTGGTRSCGYEYVDANGDGICDNRGSAGCSFTDANGDGICDNRGNGRGCGGRGRGFVDANGDGICDNGNGTCPMNGMGARNGWNRSGN